jgi:uncharacterized protein YggE
MKRLALPTLLVALLGHAPALARPSDPAPDRKLEDTPRLTVRGEAELRRPADQMRIQVGVVSEAKEAGAALRDNSERMAAVVKAIAKAGLTEDEYQTGRFRIRPTYSRRPRQPQPDWKPMIIGYEVTNTVIIRTGKMDLAGSLIETANAAGANTVEVTGFDLADPRTHRAEAIGEATRHAIDDATTLAAAAGVDLVRIVSINLDRTPPPVADAYMARGRAAMAEAGSTPPISPGDVTVRASVTIVYEIDQKHPQKKSRTTEERP